MYGFFGEMCRVAYGDLCFLRRHLPETVVSAMVGPLLYLVAFAYGMRSGDSEAGVSYVAYAIPGIVAMTSMTAGFTSTAQKIIIQRLFHTSFDELILSPMHTSSIVFGKAVIGMLRGLIGSAILLVLGLFLTPDLILGPGTVASLLLSCVMFSLLGVAAGLLARSSVSLNVFTSLVIMPMTFLCGTIFSVSALPLVIGDIVWALPLTHSSEVIRASALGWDIPWISVAVMFVYLIVFYAMDYTIIRRKFYRSPKGAVLLHEHILHARRQSDLGRVDQADVSHGALLLSDIQPELPGDLDNGVVARGCERRDGDDVVAPGRQGLLQSLLDRWGVEFVVAAAVSNPMSLTYPAFSSTVSLFAGSLEPCPISITVVRPSFGAFDPMIPSTTALIPGWIPNASAMTTSTSRRSNSILPLCSPGPRPNILGTNLSAKIPGAKNRGRTTILSGFSEAISRSAASRLGSMPLLYA